MPRMSGFDLWDQVRSLPSAANFPVIFVTALDNFTAPVRSAKSGGSDFIAKPFLPIELTVKSVIHLVAGRIQAADGGLRPLGSE
ncbi:MAG: response regulator [Verrucomicrobia bacterium]|nr:response regulator [Verrucomicrobiota bacterium]